MVPSLRDVVLVGGGLANGLIAARLLETRANIRLAIIESQSHLGGRHTWSFFGSDLNARQREWIEPFISYRWLGYNVRFPTFQRNLPEWYASIESSRFNERMLSLSKNGQLSIIQAEVVDIASNYARLSDGSRIYGRAIIDGRGSETMPEFQVEFQKFLGQVVEVAEPHGIIQPILMDATVPQVDGYRFMYVLPFTERSLLIEDTRYTEAAALDRIMLRAEIAGYAQRQGWNITRILREEEGVLPITLAGNIEKYWRRHRGIPRSGMRAVLFHHTTGYSLTDAVVLADAIARLPELTNEAVQARIQQRSMRRWNEQAFFRMLNRMVFKAARPEQRYRIFERFYALKPGVIRRFYASSLKFSDKVRILLGKPPVPVLAALRSMLERRG